MTMLKSVAPEGTRKWSATIIALVSSTLAVGCGWIDGAEYQMIMMATVGVFVAGNFGEHKAKNGRNGT